MTSHIQLIHAELDKRSTTYPRILEKKQIEWVEQGLDVDALTTELADEQRSQYNHLLHAIDVLEGMDYLSVNCPDIWRELCRELRMRKKYYPRWVRWNRMTQEAADNGIKEWQELCDDFHQNYCADAKIRKTKKEITSTHSQPTQQ